MYPGRPGATNGEQPVERAEAHPTWPAGPRQKCFDTHHLTQASQLREASQVITAKSCTSAARGGSARISCSRHADSCSQNLDQLQPSSACVAMSCSRLSVVCSACLGGKQWIVKFCGPWRCAKRDRPVSCLNLSCSTSTRVDLAGSSMPKPRASCTHATPAEAQDHSIAVRCLLLLPKRPGSHRPD